jgi:hypothetical protein
MAGRARKLAWFFGLWVAGVATIAVVAYGLRLAVVGS